MDHTMIYDETRPRIPNRAVSYRLDGSIWKDIDYTPVNLIYGDGNVNTCVQDMLRWIDGLDRSTLVKRSTEEMAFTPARLINGTSTAYGFGWNIENFQGLKCLGHNGSWVGFATAERFYPEKHAGVVILSNRADFEGHHDAFCNEISEIYFR